ncbi:Glycerate dehydrogenase [compost metagenome]
MKPTLVIAFPISSDVIERAQHSFEVISKGQEAMSMEELIALCQTHEPQAVMVSMTHKINREVLESFPGSIKIVATCSVGYDHFDLKAAQEKGIYLTNTPDVLTAATADLAMMLMLNACRRAREYNQIMETGWGRSFGQNEMLGLEVSGRVLGILGMGRIGQAVADRARGFGMKILYSNRSRLSPELEKDATYFENFEDMLPHCEILSLHAPATAETQDIINKRTLALLPMDAVFVNVARGALVDEEALLEALSSRALFSAGLDVFKNEPNFDQRFVKLPNVVLTPHMGSATRETRNEMGFRALENILQVIAGKKPRDLLFQDLKS